MKVLYPTCVSVSLSFCLSVCLSVSHCLSLSLCLSLSVSQSLSLSVSQFLCLSVSLSLYLSVFFCLSVSLSVSGPFFGGFLSCQASQCSKDVCQVAVHSPSFFCKREVLMYLTSFVLSALRSFSKKHSQTQWKRLAGRKAEPSTQTFICLPHAP